MKCKRCGTQLEDGARFCPACGYPDVDYGISPNFCSNCGQPLLEAGSVCPVCGRKNESAQEKADK